MVHRSFKASDIADESIDDDPVIVAIRQAADVIRHIGQNTQTFSRDAWSKRQLEAMIDEISFHADKILQLTGVKDLEAHFDQVWGKLIEDRNVVTGNGFDEPFRPYADEEGE